MQIETQRLLIRDIETDDAIPFAIMAADGTLNDCGFDKDCRSWITKWITEAKNSKILLDKRGRLMNVLCKANGQDLF